MDSLKASLKLFRKEAILCDVKILSRDKEHKAHRVILAAASDFFRTMLESDFKEAQSGVIKLKDISSDLIDALLDFIYTEVVDINGLNACDLYCLADRLAIKNLKDRCRVYLLEKQDTTNCLSIVRLARCYNDKLLEKITFDFILQNFINFTLSDEFSELTKDEMMDIVARNELNAEKEEDVYNAVISWADTDPGRRDKELAEIFKFIRFPLMDVDFLEINVVNNGRVSDQKWNATIFDIFHRCARYYRHNEHHAFFWMPKNMPCYSRELRAPPFVIYITGGWSNGRCLAVTECYNPKSDCWSTAQSLRDPDGPKCYYGSALLGQQAYFAGGYNGNAYLNAVRCFNPVSGLWSEVAPMHHKRCFTSLVNFSNKMYAIGGFDGIKRLSTVESYCASLNQWTRVASLGTTRSDSAAVVCRNRIYVIGGYNGDSLRSVEYYDGEVWRYAAPMNDRRSGSGAVTLGDGRIFVMGGYDGVSRQKTTEFYDPQSNMWINGPAMHIERSNFATCVIGSHVYVIGGYTGHNTLQDVERYDVTLNSWTAVAKLNSGRSAMKACVFTGLQDLKDFIYNRNSNDVRDCLLNGITQSEVIIERLLQRENDVGRSQN